MRASTVYLPQAAFVELETLRGKSGKKGFKRLGLTETARAVIRLVFGREWLPEKSEKLFPNLKSRGGDIQRVFSQRLLMPKPAHRRGRFQTGRRRARAPGILFREEL